MREVIYQAAWMALILVAASTNAESQSTSAKKDTAAATPTPATTGTATTEAADDAKLNALEKKLLGHWKGPACGGDYTFNADGTFELCSFTPGGNTLAGTWSLRWDALPPTLVLTCKTSDFRTKDSSREEYKYLGQPLEVKVIELDSEKLVYRMPDAEQSPLPANKRERSFQRRAATK